MLDVYEAGGMVREDAATGVHGLCPSFALAGVQSALGATDEVINGDLLARKKVALFKDAIIGRVDCGS